MTTVTLLDWILLVWLLVVLPAGAVSSARAMRESSDPDPEAAVPSKAQLIHSTLIMLSITFVLSWFVSRQYGWNLFASPRLGAREIGAGVIALLFLVLLRVAKPWIDRGNQSNAVKRLTPRSGSDWMMYGTMSVAAGIAEEAAYRGALLSVLLSLVGSTWLAIAISAVAFAVGHAVQGWRTGVLVLIMALAMHALVFLTGTLVITMVVHAGYDLLAGAMGAREARREKREGKGVRWCHSTSGTKGPPSREPGE